jgi:cation diffusion facilitator family transporter
VSHDGSRKVVLAALAGNVAIMTCKFVAAYFSRSTATLAEAVHSMADTGNEALLLVGIALAARPASARFPFGRASERYFWPFVVALMLLSMGGAFAVWEGVTHVISPAATPPGSRTWSYVVLGLSFVFETLSIRVALREFRETTGGKPWREALLGTRDPTVPLVLAEDATALVGLAVALLAVLLSQVTGWAWLDPVGSILIGVLLAVVAVVLAWVTHGLLIGASATLEDRARVLSLANATPRVLGVTQLLTMHLGPDDVLLALKVAFDPTLSVQEIEDTTNELERRIRTELPAMKKIFVEVDAHGDGRGVDSVRRSGAMDAPPP